MVSGSISTFLSKCFSPFPHGTGSLSVSFEYLALPDGPGGFAQDFSCPALLRIPLCSTWLRVPDSHRLRSLFPKRSTRRANATSRSYNPEGASRHPRFGLFPVRSPLLGESLIYLFSLPEGTKMFQFPSLAPAMRPASPKTWVVPFGYPRVKGHLRLTVAFRSLSRPSSPE